MMPLTAALMIPTRALWEQAHACIQNLPVRIAMEQNEPSEADSLLDRIEKHRIDVVLLEAGILNVPLEEFVSRLAGSSKPPAIFVLNTEASPAGDSRSPARGRQRVSASAPDRLSAGSF